MVVYCGRVLQFSHAVTGWSGKKMQDSKDGRLNKGRCLRKELANDKADEVMFLVHSDFTIQ